MSATRVLSATYLADDDPDKDYHQDPAYASLRSAIADAVGAEPRWVRLVEGLRERGASARGRLEVNPDAAVRQGLYGVEGEGLADILRPSRALSSALQPSSPLSTPPKLAVQPSTAAFRRSQEGQRLRRESTRDFRHGLLVKKGHLGAAWRRGL